MRPDLGQIGNIADVVANTVLVLVGGVQLEPHVYQHIHCFEDGDAVLPAASEIIDLATAGLAEKVQEQMRYVAGVDLVAHLLTQVAEDCIRSAGYSAHNDIGKIAV